MLKFLFTGGGALLLIIVIVVVVVVVKKRRRASYYNSNTTEMSLTGVCVVTSHCHHKIRTKGMLMTFTLQNNNNYTNSNNNNSPLPVMSLTAIQSRMNQPGTGTVVIVTECQKSHCFHYRLLAGVDSM